MDVLKRRLRQLRVGEIKDEDLERVGFALLNDERNSDDPLYKVGERCFLGDGSLEEFRNLLVRTLYQVGALGVKLEAYESVRWSHTDEPLLSEEYVTSDTSVSIHKTFWAALGIVRQAKGIPTSR
jgi:hypothetical protein